MWAALAAVVTVAAVIVQTLLMIVLAVVGWGLTALVGWIEFRSDMATVHRTGKPIETKPQSIVGRASRGGRAPSGGKAADTGSRRRVCSAACQRSAKPASHCKCVCKGATHGAKRTVVGVAS